jgi:glycerol dehydrogenase-like iron-containing ADH family enzyme
METERALMEIEQRAAERDTLWKLQWEQDEKELVQQLEDAEAARKVRREVLQRIVDANAMIGGFHFPFPAFGKAVAQGQGYAFQPVA